MDVDEKADADFDVVLGEEYSVGASDSEVVFCSADDEVEEVNCLEASQEEMKAYLDLYGYNNDLDEVTDADLASSMTLPQLRLPEQS